MLHSPFGALYKHMQGSIYRYNLSPRGDAFLTFHLCSTGRDCVCLDLLDALPPSFWCTPYVKLTVLQLFHVFLCTNSAMK